MVAPEASIALLRHTVATLAYRANKAVSGAPPEFADFGQGRTAGQILAHIGDLFDWALTLAEGRHEWHDSPPLDWNREVARFFRLLSAFDRRLASPQPLGCTPERLFQGPIADALTHTGQIAMLRRLAGLPIKGENYFKADIAAGNTSPDQPTPRLEF